MKKKAFLLVFILTFILSITAVLVACDGNGGNDGEEYPIKAYMSFSMDGVEYTYELVDNGGDQTFTVKYGTSTMSYDVIKIGEHYNVCNGVADFIIENGELKIYSIGNAINFITPRSYHAGTHIIDGETVTLQEDGTFVTASGNKKYYVVDGNKLVVPDDNGSGVVYSKTVGEYVKAGTFYGNSVCYPDITWKTYEYDKFVEYEAEKSLSFNANVGKYFIKGESGDSQWYYGNVTKEGNFVVLNCGNEQKKFCIDEENATFDDAYQVLTNEDGEELRLYYHGKAVFVNKENAILYVGEKVDFNDGYVTIKRENIDDYTYFVYDENLKLIVNVRGDYNGMPEGIKEVKLKGKEDTKYYFYENGEEKFAYVPREDCFYVCSYEKAATDERIYEITIDEATYGAFVEGEYIYTYSDIKINDIDEANKELASATNVEKNNWTIPEGMAEIIHGTVEFTTYVVDDQEKCVLFIYQCNPAKGETESSVLKKVILCQTYTVTVEGDVTQYVITDENRVYTLKVQNDEIIYADYSW